MKYSTIPVLLLLAATLTLCLPPCRAYCESETQTKICKVENVSTVRTDTGGKRTVLDTDCGSYELDDSVVETPRIGDYLVIDVNPEDKVASWRTATKKEREHTPTAINDSNWERLRAMLILNQQDALREEMLHDYDNR